ncbi:MAG: C10 family peptidase [Prevotella sp.]|nr:C10 family peptidase [Prevotella sp.]
MERIKLLLSAFIIVLLCACTTEDFQEEEVSQNIELSKSIKNKRSYTEAYEIAQKAATMFEHENPYLSRSKKVRKIDTQKGVHFVTQQYKPVGTLADANGRRMSRSNEKDTLLYVFNYENNQGFAVVSANKNTDALLAVTDSGYYDPAIGTDNPGLAMFMDMAETYSLEDGDYERIPPTTPIPLLQSRTVKDTIEYVNIPKKINLRWGQDGLYGIYCPNSTSGCANTAAAMVIAYYEHPASMDINFETAIPHTLTFNWGEIKSHVSGIEFYGTCCSSETHSDIAKLMRQLGHLSNSDYSGINQTLTTEENIRNVLASFGYNMSTTAGYSSSNVRSSLQDNKIILMGGFSGEDNPVGHMWIVDGYYRLHTEEHQYFSSDLGLTWYEAEGSPFVVSVEYNHINWGWGGLGNGMFNSGVFRPYNPHKLDSGCDSSSNMNDYSTNMIQFSIIH